MENVLFDVNHLIYETNLKNDKKEILDILNKNKKIVKNAIKESKRYKVKYEKKLNDFLEKNPEVKSEINSKKIENIVNKKTSKIESKLSKLDPNKVKNINESDLNNLFNFEDLITEDIGSDLGDFFRLKRLRKLKLPENIIQWLYSIVIGYVLTDIVIRINDFGIDKFVNFFSSIFDENLAESVGLFAAAIMVAPLTEELLKVIGLQSEKALNKLTGSKKLSDVPSFVFAIREFFFYVITAFTGTAALTGSLAAAGIVGIVMIIVRLYIMEMHMTTSKFYHSDIEKYGHVKFMTFIKGVVYHFVWNFLSIFVFIFGLLSVPIQILGVTVIKNKIEDIIAEEKRKLEKMQPNNKYATA